MFVKFSSGRFLYLRIFGTWKRILEIIEVNIVTSSFFLFSSSSSSFPKRLQQISLSSFRIFDLTLNLEDDVMFFRQNGKKIFRMERKCKEFYNSSILYYVHLHNYQRMSNLFEYRLKIIPPKNFLQSSIALIYLIWEDIDNRNWTISGDRASLPRFVPNKTKSNGNYIHKIFRWAGRDTISPLFLRSFDTINENGSGSSLIVAADDTTSRSRKIFKGPKYIAELERVRRNWERQREREIRKKRWQKWRKEERSLVREIEMEKRR